MGQSGDHPVVTQTSPLALLATRRLGPLVLAQACGALNNNLVKNAMVVLALFTLGVGGAGLSALAGALFIAPYVLLSATAGKLADRLAKSRLVLLYKLAEIALMLVAAAAFLSQSVPALLAVLFGLGVQAAMFGPVKYGILPELLPREELLAGNGLVEATTFLSIVAGTVLGGGLILLEHGTLVVGGLGLVVSVIGAASSARIPARPAADPALAIHPNVMSETRVILRAARVDPAIWWSILGISWFWTMGATLMTEFPVVARDTLRADGTVLTMLLTVFAVGVGVGSIGCARLLRGAVSSRLVPWAALGISVFCADFALAAWSGAGSGLTSAAGIVAAPAGWRMLLDLFGLAVCGGAFSVPLYAIIQHRLSETARSRMIGANNVMNALFMVLGAGAAAGLAALGLDAPAVLLVAAGVNLVVTGWIWRVA